MQSNRKFTDFESLHFGEEMPDGRLTVPSEKFYRIREAFLLFKKLGRQRTEEEMQQFEIKQP